ncbi:fimbrial protein [Bacteroides sp.]|uniref:fimbrial protein n=1 Tax=Bacteroides sp. TaxID=29523 RepID=UPI002A7F412A|nr:fimbrial protein [Bacteroides sp.]
MKVKSLLLSMCAIAALASCSKNDDRIPGGGSDAEEARVTIQLANEQVPTTKAIVGTQDAGINTLSALFYNDAGVLIGAPQSVTGDKQTLVTTSEACKVILVANVPTSVDLKKASTLSALEALTFSSVEGADPYTINQKATNLTMVGATDFTLEKDPNGIYTTKVTVKMHFIAAKITSVTLTVDGAAASAENYATGGEHDLTGDLSQPGNKWYYFIEAYLQLANTVSQLYPGDVANWTKFDSKMQAADFRYIGGKKWDSGQADPDNPWDAAITPAPLQTNDYNGTITFSSGTFSDVFTNRYLLENNAISNKTVLVLHGKCKVKNAPGLSPAYKVIDRYWNITFGANTSDQPYLKAGNSYTIKLTLKKSFDPDNGTAGGGGGDPTVEVKDANVEVTVTPATWNPALEINKVWD